MLIQINQPWGAAAEWEGPVKKGMATFVSHACQSPNCTLFVTGAEDVSILIVRYLQGWLN